MKNRLLILLTLIWMAVTAAASEHMLKTIDLADGLSQGSAQCITRDLRGFIWIGTHFGLNRYDNHRVTNYFADDRKGSLPDNTINFVCLDANGDLLVGCDSAVARYDYDTDSFETLEVDGQPVVARSARATDTGALLGGFGNLYHYDSKHRKVEAIKANGGSAAAYSYISTPWNNDKYILRAHWDGLWLYDPAANNIVRLPFFTDRAVRAVTIDSRQHLWVAPYDRGILCFDNNGTLLAERTTANSGLNNNIVLDFEEHDGQMWLATETGIDIADLDTYEIEPLESKLGVELNATVLTMEQDSGNNMLVGTLRHGVACIYSVPMRTYGSADATSSHKGFTVTTLIADSSSADYIWVGIDGGGVARFDPSTGTFDNFASTQGMKITDIANYSPTELLLADYRNGLWIFDKKSGTRRKLAPFSDYVNNESAGKAVATDLYGMPDGRIAAITDEVLTYNPSNGRTAKARFNTPRATNEKLNPFMLGDRYMLAYDNRHIYRYNNIADTIGAILTMPATAKITAATADRFGNMWVATGNDLYHINHDGSQITPIDSHLMHNITALAIEGTRLWIGADNRLYMINGDAVSVFGNHDGVTPNQFIDKAELFDGHHLLMGGVNGLLKIDLADIDISADRTLTAEVMLADLLADGRRIEASGRAGHVDLPAKTSSVTVRIIDHETEGMRNKLFRFNVTGGSKPIAIETFDREITLNMLPPGKYRVSVQYSTNDGSWSDDAEIVTLHVLPPWYATWWALVFYLLLGAIAAVVMWYLIRMRRHNRLTEMSRMALQDKVDLLTRIHRDLRTPLALVTAPLQTLLRRLHNSPESDQSVIKELDDIYNHSLQMREAIDTLPETYDMAKYMEEVRETSSPSSKKGYTLPKTTPTKSQPQQKSFIDKFDASAMSALVVEDNEKLRGFIVAQLQSAFKHVSAAASAHDAKLMVKAQNPDIVIVDVELPDSDGFDVCQYIKSTEGLSHIPVLLLTSGNDNDVKSQSYAHGADSYISKPFDIDVLINRCKNLLHNRSIVRSRYNRTEDKPQKQQMSNSDETFVLELNRLIAENISQPDFSVEFLAKKMAMSRTSFYNRTRQLTGRSIGQYIADYRLEQARHLLSTTKMPISEIAESLGFHSQRYFSTFFKEKTGQAPSEFRV